MAEFKVFPDPASLAREVAARAIREIDESAGENGAATWVLAGGSTPAAAYRIIAEHAADVAWDRVSVIMGDERCVPLDHPDSNWRQAVDLLLSKVPIPESGRTPPPVHLPPAEAAAEYANVLGALPGQTEFGPRLDHVWLGMGEDGHCLSLFPGHPELDVTEPSVIPVLDSPKPPPARITLTLGALRATRNCLIIAAGAGKAAAVAAARSGDLDLPVALAAHTIEEAGGTVTWLLDEAAAGN
ncbi:6-phosphogluconolactonase [Actinomadura litoris]|uniref:6-phosphogluconolactonase n=1 Tax=Actinomadura litoris TaxID=2678616 RepID=A0A7K1L0M5_9ACTN|nr:6-phosphogluconolactonase [Actinomadura litoris]MUN37984.1 6-phosphogluconolactonase [Actinomadura litoris]